VVRSAETKYQSSCSILHRLKAREKIVESLLVDVILIRQLTETMKKHFLRETDKRERGERSDRRKRRYCVGCYNKLAESLGREVAKK